MTAMGGLTALLVLVLIFVAIEDMRRYRIGNGSIIALLILSAIALVLRADAVLAVAHVVFAVAVFAALLVAYRLRLAGGGDVKLLGTALLWIGPPGAFAFSVVLIIATMAYGLGAWAGVLPAKSGGKRLVIPFGPAIAVAWGATAVFLLRSPSVPHG